MNLKQFFISLTVFFSLQISAQNQYKCLVQTINYSGEATYIAVSLISPKGEYEKTLYVFGDDGQWYDSLKKWFSFYDKKNEKIDAITGASILGGERKTIMLNLDNTKLNKGYTIRFESVVEDQYYYNIDAEIPFSDEGLKNKIEGKGYIRYARVIPAK
jgi:alpha-tubulin N-acetyltransferase